MIINPSKEQLKSLKGIIYYIKNKVTEQYYIGQTKHSFFDRYGFLWHRGITNKYLKRSIKKYGFENFEIAIIIHNISTKQELNKLEDEWVIFYNAYAPMGFNLCPCGNNLEKRFSKKLSEQRSISNSRIHKFINIKTGELIEVRNLSKWAEKHGYSPEPFYKLTDCGSIAYNTYVGINFKFKNSKDFYLLRYRKNLNPPFIVYKNKTKYEFNSIEDFSKENNIGYIYYFLDLLDGKRKSYKGFTLKDTSVMYCTQKYFNFALLGPKNKLYFFRDTRDFCLQTNLPKNRIEKVLLGKAYHYKGYRLPFTVPTPNQARTLSRLLWS